MRKISPTRGGNDPKLTLWVTLVERHQIVWVIPTPWVIPFALWSVKVYLNGTDCCRVLQSDTVGICNERGVCPVGYELGAAPSDGVLYQLADDNNASFSPSIGSTFVFDSLILPYHFAIGAAYDTGHVLCM